MIIYEFKKIGQVTNVTLSMLLLKLLVITINNFNYIINIVLCITIDSYY